MSKAREILEKIEKFNVNEGKTFLDVITPGGIDVSNKGITSLKGAPGIVKGDFSCNNNMLISLEHAPKEVGGSFSVTNNKKRFTEEEVRAVSNVKGGIFV